MLFHAAMDHRINSYRLIMESTRAVLGSEGTGSCGSPGPDRTLEDVFEELILGEEFEELPTDGRLDLVHELLTTERVYCAQLRSVLDVYAEPLRKFSSMTSEDHRILFMGVEPILSISAMLMSKLEDTLKSWDSSGTQIGNLFSSKLWNHYEEYCDNYADTRQLLEDKFKCEDSFVTFCDLRRGKAEHTIHTLLHLPVQRIPEYDKYLSDLLDETDHGHPDYDDLYRAHARVKKMVREHEDEFGTSPENLRMDSIQKRFPNDDLQLRESSSSAAQRLRSLSQRRRSAPGAVLFKTLGNRSKSTTSLGSHGAMGKKEMDIVNPFRHPDTVNRQYLMEGQVEFCRSEHLFERYLFLFNDLLLVAKQKTSTTFKLKARVRVCEMWISNSVQDVTDLPRSLDRSFVIGWPTTNVIATFKSTESKELWFNKLTEQIKEEKSKETYTCQMKLDVFYRDMEQKCTVDINCDMEAKDVLKKCLDHFQIPESEAHEYQICVKSGKEDNSYPLIGHENPFNIKMSHVRDIYQTRPDEPIIPADYDKVLEEAPADLRCQFYLKHNKKSPKKGYGDDGITKHSKKDRSKSLMKFFRRNKDDKNNNTAPSGKLFGHPLEDVITANGLPKCIMELLKILFREGPHTTGIFRKSANARKQRELRLRLDEDDADLDDDTGALVVGAVLKEYLRSLPECLLLDKFYDDWLSLNDDKNGDSPHKLALVKSLLIQLPPCHFDLLRHLMCVLYYIEKRSSENLMTAYNLAVCIAPSILWSRAHTDPLKDLASTTPLSIVAYLIKNCGEVFGEESLGLFGNPCDQKRQDSSTDSDSMHSVLSMPDSSSGGTNRRDDSSIDSLEREVYIGPDMDSSPNLAKSHLSPSNLSRDSGLMLSDNQLYDDDSSSVEMLVDRKGYSRSVSQYIDRDNEKSGRFDNVCSQSCENFYEYGHHNPKPPPRKNRRKENEASDPSPNMEMHRHQTIYSRTADNRYDNSPKSTLSQSLSADAYHRYNHDSSSESLRSIEDRVNTASEQFGNWQKQKRSEQTLIKSASGMHLYIDNEDSRLDIKSSGRSNRDKLTRQASVTSTPPMSPQSKYSFSESVDSALTDSSSSYLPHQSSHDTDFSDISTSWYGADDYHSSMDSHRLQQSFDDSSVDLNSSLQRKRSSGSKSTSSPHFYHQSPSTAYQSPRGHTSLALCRSFPMESGNLSKGSGSTTSKEAEDIITKPKLPFSSYASEEVLHRPRSTEPAISVVSPKAEAYTSNMPLKQMSRYSTGLGTSPPPRVVLQSMRQGQGQKNTPVRASYDSAIVSQVRKSSLDSESRRDVDHISEFPAMKQPPSSPNTLRRSESDSEINRTLTNSPDKIRPDHPPSYDMALQRNFMLSQGIPIEITESDEKKQKEASAKAKSLYEDSLRKYMEEHLNSPSTQRFLPQTPPTRKVEVKNTVKEDSDEEHKETTEEDIYVELKKPEKDPKKLYEESRKAYERSVQGDMKNNNSMMGHFSGSMSPVRDSKTLAVPVCNLHRSYSDSADHMLRKSPKRERSPLATEIVRRDSRTNTRGGSPHHRGLSPDNMGISPHNRSGSPNNNSRLSYSSSSVSNSSSDTVTDTQLAASPSYRERAESSPVITRHVFPTAESYSTSYVQNSAKSRDMSPAYRTPQGFDKSVLSASSSRDSSRDSRYSTESSRDSISQNLSNELEKVTISSKDSSQQHVSNKESNKVVLRKHSGPRVSSGSHGDTRMSQHRTSIATSTGVELRKYGNPPGRRNEEVRNSSDLPWSVKHLRTIYQSQGKGETAESAVSGPPPYQPPPPFRRNIDNTRMSTSSSSSAGSTGGRNTPPTWPHSVHPRVRGEGPQTHDSSAEDSDTSSRYSGQGRRDTTSSSDEQDSVVSYSRTYYTDISYV
ncbi:rho GTPase-activating protein 20-like isoform X1 [Pecten maximus]|uniref:rho GTPase-activating protein 20-like isoform X1 n=2 Tax=Pecten maximus TaxID=6579 RepID=UPI00145874EE|nr:rho GTPase-activating protein 20-like isoform X1 [Pecten maximus]